jgi:battenin
VLYVIILSSALDLVGPSVPKGVVLLADVVPSFFTKLVAPYFIHKVPYQIRILVFVALSACGMLLVALTPTSRDGKTIAVKMSGVILASFSSGGGELSFLGLTHYYGHFSLAAWGSGTGGAGLVGAGAYAIATISLGLSVRTSLLAFSFLPIIMLISFFIILPLGHLKAGSKHAEYERLEEDHSAVVSIEESDFDISPNASPEGERLLDASMHSASGRSFTSINQSNSRTRNAWNGLKANLARSRGLFFP